MNNERRKKIIGINEQIEGLKSDLEAIRDEERDYYDAMPESIQNGDKGQRASDCADALEEVVQSLDDAISRISDALD